MKAKKTNKSESKNHKNYLKSLKYRTNRRNKENKFLKEIINTLLYISIKKLLFIIFLIIILFPLLTTKSKKTNNYKPKKISVYSSNSTLNKGFLEIKTIHKGKFTHYDYESNIKIYKDLYKDKSLIPITEKNSILSQSLISKEEYCKICEKGILLDKNKYKRN